MGIPTYWINLEVEPFDLHIWMAGEILISPIALRIQLNSQNFQGLARPRNSKTNYHFFGRDFAIFNTLPKKWKLVLELRWLASPFQPAEENQNICKDFFLEKLIAAWADLSWKTNIAIRKGFFPDKKLILSFSVVEVNWTVHANSETDISDAVDRTLVWLPSVSHPNAPRLPQR